VLLYVGAAVAVADAGSVGLRALIGRDRPADVDPDPKPLIGVPHDGALPSGHASVAFASATILAWVMPRLAVPLFLLAAAIAWSRVYVGAHYPLDVLAGAALGVLTALALRAMGRRWQRRQARGARTVPR
jgi:undecaprenyl-diphosphatase